MSKSRQRKRKIAKKSNSQANEHNISFESLTFGDGDRENFKKSTLEAANQKVVELPKLRGRLIEILRNTSPEGIITTFSFYGSHATVTNRGEVKELKKDILQSHIELLQGLILILPREEWGNKPVTAQVMEELFDIVPKISNTFFFSRVLARSAEDDPDKQAVLELQEIIRLHTQVVRNWGFYTDVIQISRDIYTPLNDKFLAALGFSPKDLIDVGEHLVSELERRSNAHMTSLTKALAGKTPEDIVRRYYKYMPGMEGDPENFIKAIPPGTSRTGVMSALISHADLSHLLNMAFTIPQVAAAAGKSEAATQKILDVLSIKPDELIGTNVEYLFLGNPVWTRPGMNLEGIYVFPLPQAIFSHINEIVRHVAALGRLETELSDRRSEFLEQRTFDLLSKALPTAKILPGAKWTLGGQTFETDVLAIVDRTAFIAEAKSHRVTPEGLRGAPDRLKRHLRDLVIEPSIQSERLAALISRDGKGLEGAKEVADELGIFPNEIDQVIRISVTLDDLSVLSSAEESLKNAGWIPENHALAPSLHIADLECIVDILENEIHFIHYFSERFYIQKQFDLTGDELDFLGLYLSTGFNLGSAVGDRKQLLISGMSSHIDHYYETKRTGRATKKPSINIGILYKKIIGQLSLRRSPGWITAGIHLLNSASPSEQKNILRELIKLKRNVKQNGDKENHICFMQVTPPLDRKSRIGFYVHGNISTHDKRRRMENFGARSLDESGAEVCVIFGRDINDWEKPYDSVLILYHTDVDATP